MANRLTTVKGGDIGLWVSKAGTNVVTTGVENLLLSSSDKTLQIIASGTTSNQTSPGSVNISWPNVGFTPMIFTSSPRWLVDITYTSATAATLNIRARTPPAPTTASGVITWFAMSVPV